MAIKIGANLAYNGKLPNFERDSFETKADMKAFDENSIDEGHLSYCKEDGNIYQYKSSNPVDDTTGRWRLFKTDADAVLNGTSTNAIQNKAVFDALKLKADATALDKYQPKYKADYIAKEDLSEWPITKGILDLNGHSINAPFVNNDGELTIQNGTILEIAEINYALNIINCTIKNTYVRIPSDCQIAFNNSSIEHLETDDNIYCHIYNSNVGYLGCDCKQINIYNSTVNELTCNYGGYNTVVIGNSYISTITYDNNSQVEHDGSIYLYNCVFEVLNLDSYPRSIDVQLCSCCDYNNDITYVNGYYDNTHGLRELAYRTEIQKGDNVAPTSDAVYNALQLKADKTQLNDLATKTELNGKADASALNNYVTTATANTTYATKVSLNNEVNQLVEEINLKLDDTVAASTYLRKDDANTTYAKKSDISNVYKFKGTKTNYSELPTTGVVTGDVWNITNADAEHGIKAGDNVAWNGTGWDNLSGVTDLSAYATTTTTDAMSADIKKLMDKAFPFTVKVSLDKTLAKKGTSQPVKVTITPKIGDDNVDADEIMINGAEYHGATPYVYSATATATTTYNVRVRKDDRTAQGSATITFVNPSYDGAVAANFTVTEANIKALTETLRSEKGGTRTFNLNNQKACIAYPKAFGAATGIKDANGFDYLDSYTRSELNVNGELYYVYLLTNAATITDMKQTIS